MFGLQTPAMKWSFRVAIMLGYMLCSTEHVSSNECSKSLDMQCDAQKSNADKGKTQDWMAELMVQARDLAESGTDDSDESRESSDFLVPTSKATRNRPVTATELKFFQREGYLILRNFFSADEMKIVRSCIEQDPSVMGKNISVPDASGLHTKLTLWWTFGDDVYGRLGRSASLVKAASDLMGGAEPYSSHTKILLKEPHTGGAWEWHQDFGYWYAQGLNQPDKIVSSIIAIDDNDHENGAMRILTGSHKLGRLDHGVYGGQAGADPVRVLDAARDPDFKVKTLTLKSGDIAFTHSNLLHCSRPNTSSRWRRNVIVAYNSKSNEPIENSIAGQPPYTKIDIVPDGVVKAEGCKFLDPNRKDFMEPQDTKASIDDNPVLQ